MAGLVKQGMRGVRAPVALAARPLQAWRARSANARAAEEQRRSMNKAGERELAELHAQLWNDWQPDVVSRVRAARREDPHGPQH